MPEHLQLILQSPSFPQHLGQHPAGSQSMQEQMNEQMFARIWLHERAGWRCNPRAVSCPQTHIHTSYAASRVTAALPLGPSSDKGGGGAWGCCEDKHPRAKAVHPVKMVLQTLCILQAWLG